MLFIMKYFQFRNQNILLTCQFLVSIFPPLVPQTSSSEGLVIERVQGIFGLQRRDFCYEIFPSLCLTSITIADKTYLKCSEGFLLC